MSEATHLVEELLEKALRDAGEVAQARVGRSLQLVPAALPNSTSLLRFDLNFSEGATLSWYVSNDDATGLSDILIGGPGDRAAVLTEAHLDALSEVFDTMLGRAVDGINTALDKPLTMGGVDMRVEGALPELTPGDVGVVRGFEIEGFGVLTVVEVANQSLAAVLAAHIVPGGVNTPAPPLDQVSSVGVSTASSAGSVPAADVPTPQQPATDALSVAEAEYDNVVQLPSLTEVEDNSTRGDLTMLLNVPLSVTVELGSTERSVQDLLNLSIGSILELNKLAGDAMDILVNGKVLARGEVVVIDEEFGIRITEILSPEQRLRSIS